MIYSLGSTDARQKISFYLSNILAGTLQMPYYILQCMPPPRLNCLSSSILGRINLLAHVHVHVTKTLSSTQSFWRTLASALLTSYHHQVVPTILGSPKVYFVSRLPSGFTAYIVHGLLSKTLTLISALYQSLPIPPLVTSSPPLASSWCCYFIITSFHTRSESACTPSNTSLPYGPPTLA